MGASLETGLLALLRLTQLVHAKLPEKRDPLWNEIAKQSNEIAHAATQGASIGMAYHLFVDGLLQPAAYHGLFVSMPMAAHQTIFEVNAAAEALDVGNKPCVARAKTRKASGERRAPADPVIGAGLPVQRGSVEKKTIFRLLKHHFLWPRKLPKSLINDNLSADRTASLPWAFLAVRFVTKAIDVSEKPDHHSESCQ